MNCVFVLDSAKRPMTPCRPAQARRMLRDGKAAVFRRFPFTLILKETKPAAVVKPLTAKIDPGSRFTGIALTDTRGRVLFAAELQHRGQSIKAALQDRRAHRRNRRSRNTRYRAPRFLNRRRPEGWLPPSLQHRVDTTMTWVGRLRRFALVEEIGVERVKFDTQKLQNPEIAGVKYQQGELFGYEVKEYLLEKFGRVCAYCGGITNDPVLEVEHIVPPKLGGSNRVSNLTIACSTCNREKGKCTPQMWADALAGSDREIDQIRRENCATVHAKAKAPLKDAAAVNMTRWALYRRLTATGLPVETGTGAQTKFNRSRLGYPKAHWIDAACVGESGAAVTLDAEMVPLRISAKGHGNRQMCGTNKYGFPIRHRNRQKQFAGFQTGDLVQAVVPTGKFSGTHSGRIAIRHRPSFRIQTAAATFDVHPKYLTLVHRADGYAYA